MKGRKSGSKMDRPNTHAGAQAREAGPVLTETLKFHATGTKFTTRITELYADGQPTGIMHVGETSGRPEYRYVRHVLAYGEEELDLLANPKPEAIHEWIVRHIPAKVVGP